MRYLVLVFLLLFAVGALAAGLVPLPWTISPEKVPDPRQANQSRSEKKAAARSSASTTQTSETERSGTSSKPTTAAKAKPVTDKQTAAGVSAKTQTTRSQSQPKASAATASGKFGIDVARIERQGSSVIAGFSAPLSRVAILANGKVIGTTVADERGDWVLVTSHQFADTDPKLTLKQADGNVADTTANQQQSSARKDTAAQRSNNTKSPPPTTSRSSGKPDAPPGQNGAGQTGKSIAAASGSRTAGGNADAASTKQRRTADDVATEMMQRLRRLTRKAEKDQAPPTEQAMKAPASALQTGQPQTSQQRTSQQRNPKTQNSKSQASSSQTDNSRTAKSDIPVKIVAVSPSGLASAPRSVSQSKTALPAVASLSKTSVSYLGRRQTAEQPADGAARQTEALSLNTINASDSSPATSAVSSDRVASVSPPVSSRITANRQSAKLTETLPVPVQFIFRKASFTEQGQEAAQLLLAYLKAKNFKAVTLSGHADERGSAEANKRLSRLRLNQLEKFLRDGGFRGDLKLIAKGESEKYTGVDRSQFPLDELYQLDRRVEVVAAQ